MDYITRIENFLIYELQSKRRDQKLKICKLQINHENKEGNHTNMEPPKQTTTLTSLKVRKIQEEGMNCEKNTQEEGMNCVGFFKHFLSVH